MYYTIVEGESIAHIVRALNKLAQNEGMFPHGNAFFSTDGSKIYHAAVKKKMPGHIPLKMIYFAVGGSLEEVIEKTNELHDTESYVALGDVFWCGLDNMWCQLIVLGRFAP